MIKPHIFGLLLSPLLLLGGASVYAQDPLTLFESVASDAPVEATDGGREQRNLPSGPSFTLVGTSRIGDRHRATLASSNGEIVVVSTSPGVSQDIPDYPGYRVVGIGARRVAIAGPADMPCVAIADKGVSCDSNGVSQLTLASAAPVAPSVVMDTSNGAGANGGTAAAADEANLENPFAAALRAAAANEANGATGNGQPQDAPSAERFQPRRIAPDQVPPGMRVVRTPFGDRLVEQ